MGSGITCGHDCRGRAHVAGRNYRFTAAREVEHRDAEHVGRRAPNLWWVKSTRDNGDAPFILIDKRRTHLWLFDPAGELIGQTAVLLGLAKGDVSVPGIGSAR